MEESTLERNKSSWHEVNARAVVVGSDCVIRSGIVVAGMTVNGQGLPPEAATLAEVLCEVVQWLSLRWKWQRWPCLSCSWCVECVECYRGVVALPQLELQASGSHDSL